MVYAYLIEKNSEQNYANKVKIPLSLPAGRRGWIFISSGLVFIYPANDILY